MDSAGGPGHDVRPCRRTDGARTGQSGRIWGKHPLKVAGARPKILLPAPLAQLVEQLTLNQRVLGSSPRGGTEASAATTRGSGDQPEPLSHSHRPFATLSPHKNPRTDPPLYSAAASNRKLPSGCSVHRMPFWHPDNVVPSGCDPDSSCGGVNVLGFGHDSRDGSRAQIVGTKTGQTRASLVELTEQV